MLLRAALLASAFSALILAAEPPAAPVFSGQTFPDLDKNLTQLTQQVLDKQVRTAITGKHDPAKPFGGPWQMAQAFPAIPPGAMQRTPVVCSIPLLETKGTATGDRIGKSLGKSDFDRMSKPAPVPACKNWR